MEWSYGKNRMVSALERLIENKPKKIQAKDKTVRE